MNTDIEKYKYCPEGSDEKFIYDSYFMPKNKYIIKYYNNKSKYLNRFDFFYKTYISPILNKENRDKYMEFLYQKKPQFIVDYLRFDEFTQNVDKKSIVDFELYYFLAFLFSINFFGDLKSFYIWKEEKKFFNDETFNTILDMEFGSNFIKANLRELKILNS